MARKDPFDSNPFAAPDTDLTTEDNSYSGGEFVYGGFLTRFAAAFVDGIITNVLAIGLAFPAGFLLGLSGLHQQNPGLAEATGWLIGLLTGWLYSALLESSDMRATLGKKIVGLKVVNLSGGKLSFGQATGRHFGKIVSLITLGIGYFIQPFTERKQALHDMMAGALVIKA
jgi:uncharacterized RDD family membrane protein YckC